MSERIILVESRVSEFRDKFNKKFSQDQMIKIVDEIPSKYYQWVGKNLDQIGFNTNFPIIKGLLDYFNKFGSNLQKTDIFNYKSIDELKTALDQYAERQRRNYKKIQGANIVYESPRYLVVNPLSFESSCYYGKGTKWCTSGRDQADTFNKYNTEGKLFYIIDKTLPSTDLKYKVGLSLKFNGDESYYDAIDNTLRDSVLFEQPEFKKIIEKIKNYLKSEYSEQVKVEEDKKREKTERDRLRQLEIKKIKLAKKQEADERRVEQEWALTNDLDEEGQKAWAILNYLENEGADVRDKEQEERLSEIQVQLDRLNVEYDASENFDSEIYDQITELEDERDEILKMIDVYYIVPMKYEHYGLSQFEVDHDDFYGQTYAVGNESEVEEAAIDYVDGLVDEIGIAGFNKSFYSNFIDEDAVLDHARGWYDDDLSQNPEAYLDDEDRMLSDGQMDQILFKKSTITKLEAQMEILEKLSLDIEDEEQISSLEDSVTELEEKIEELKSDIEDIETAPEGDWPDELIDKKLEDLLSDVERNIEYYMEDNGLNGEDFIDMDKFKQAVVDEDGYGQLSPYDGTYEIFNVMGTEYYVFRID